MRRMLLATTAALIGLGSTVVFAQPDWQGPPAWRTQGQRATHALNLLESRGYSGFYDFHAVGPDFAANIRQDGGIVHVLVHPGTGQIQQQA